MNMIVLLVVAAPMKLIGPMPPIDVMAIAEFDQNELVILEAGVGDNKMGGWVHIDHTHPMLLVVDRQIPIPSGVRLHLNSGEVLPGQIEATADVDHIAWRHPWLGRLEFPLDMVAGIGRYAPPKGEHLDVMTLTNGDQIIGFCASIGPEITMEVSQKEGTVEQRTIPWRTMKSIHLTDANIEPPTGCSAFRDGTVVRLEHLRRDADELLHHEPHPATTHAGLGAPASSWTTLALGDHVLPLGEATITIATPQTLEPIIGGPSVLNTDPIRLRGTGAWRVDIPIGMTHFRALIRIPSHLQHLAGGMLTIELDKGAGPPLEACQIDLSGAMTTNGVRDIDIDIQGAKAMVVRRTGGVMGEVGATVDLVDGVLFGDLQGP